MNIDGEKLHISWTTWGTLMKLLVNKRPMIILKVTKIRAPPPSLEDVFLEKPQVVSYWILPSPSLFRFKETKKHSTCKVTQIIDFPIMTPKCRYFTGNVCNFFTFWANIFKQTVMTPAFKKGYENPRGAIVLLIFYLSLVKYLKSFLVSKGPCLWIKSFRNNNEVFGRIILHDTSRKQHERCVDNKPNSWQYSSIWSTINNLSKDFVCLPQSKSNAYGFRLKTLKMMNNSQGN